MEQITFVTPSKNTDEKEKNRKNKNLVATLAFAGSTSFHKLAPCKV